MKIYDARKVIEYARQAASRGGTSSIGELDLQSRLLALAEIAEGALEVVEATLTHDVVLQKQRLVAALARFNALEESE